MSLDAGALATASFSIVFLLASGLWAERRFSSFARLPMQYGLNGSVNKMGQRHLAIWLPTGTFIVLQAVNIVLLTMLDPAHINGDPELGLILTSFALAAAQAFILWLHSRWARSQS